MNTILAGTVGGISGAIFKPVFVGTYKDMNRYDIAALCNGLLSGLVAVTAAVNNVQPWQAVIIGFFGGVFYALGSYLTLKVGVDDPLEASAVHGFSGIWGIVAVGIFDNSRGLLSGAPHGKLSFLGIQLLGAFAIICWVSLISGIFFALMKYNCCREDRLRVNLIDEVIGIDIAEMGSKMDIWEFIQNNHVTDQQDRRNTLRNDLEQHNFSTAKKQKEMIELEMSVNHN